MFQFVVAFSKHSTEELFPRLNFYRSVSFHFTGEGEQATKVRNDALALWEPQRHATLSTVIATNNQSDASVTTAIIIRALRDRLTTHYIYCCYFTLSRE